MKNSIFLFFVMILSSLLLSACNLLGSDEEAVREVADEFSQRFCTWHFPDAAAYTTDRAERYLRHLSSNVSEADLEVLRAAKDMPDYSIEDITMAEDSAIVDVKLSNFAQMDTIGRPATIVENTKITLVLIKNNKEWKIKDVR